MSSSKILFFICLSFIFGIFSNFILYIPEFLIWVFLFLGIIIIITTLLFVISFDFKYLKNQQNYFLILGFCILFFCLGILRLQISQFNITNNDLIKLNNNSEKIIFTGIIISEPDNRDLIQKLKFKPDNFNGFILITKKRYPEYNYLDKVKITGNLKTPGDFGDDGFSQSYKNYLLKDKIYSVMDFPEIELISQKHDYNIFSWIYQKILFIKQELRESINKIYLPPANYIIEGTILGNSGALSEELKNQLNVTGLRHVIAVSGTHIVILSVILLNLFLFLGFWRGQSFYGSVILIWFYILLTGLVASGVRAGIMITLFLIAQKIGRNNGGLRVVVMAGVIMLLINPLLLFYDIGFQLSFLSVMGLIFLDQFIKNSILKIIKINNEKIEKLIGMFSATLSAQIFTIPIVLYNFGSVSIIAPITNILILPIVEFFMIFGFLSSFIGIFSETLGFIFSIPNYFLISYFTFILKFFSQPWAQKTFENIHWSLPVVCYLLIIFFINRIKKIEKNRHFLNKN